MAKRKSHYNWALLGGRFDLSADQIKFKGETVKYGDEPGPALGMVICNQWFGGGSISAEIEFLNPTDRSTCNLVLAFNPTTKAFLSAGLSNEVNYGIVYFDNNRWTPYSVSGDAKRSLPKRSYGVEAQVRGSIIKLLVDGVEVCLQHCPCPYPEVKLVCGAVITLRYQ